MRDVRVSIEESMKFGNGLSYYFDKDSEMEKAERFLISTGWLIVENCTKTKNPMTRTRKPRLLKHRRKSMITAKYFWHPELDRWATLGYHYINNRTRTASALFIDRQDR